MAGVDLHPSDLTSSSGDHSIQSGSLIEFPPLIGNSNSKSSQNRGFGMDWSNVLATKSHTEDCSLMFKSSDLMDGKKAAAVKSIDFEDAVKDCKNLVIGFFAGRKLSFSMVKDAIVKQWKPKAEVTISTHGVNANAFVFNFVNEDDRKIALEQGSFFILKQLFIVRPWSLLVEQSIAEMKTIPVWVMIYDVPLHLWNKLGLSVISSYLGNPLMMDECTKKKTRLTYARVCVEIDFECSFPTSIPLWIDRVHIMDLPVEYQWKPAKCLKCSSYGHKPNSCSTQVGKKKAHWINKKNQQHNPKNVASVVERGETNAGKENDLRSSINEELGERNATVGVPVGVVDTDLEVPSSNGVVEVSKTVESGDVIEEPFIKSKTYARRNKSSSSHEQIPICYLNPYNVLGSDSEIPKNTENDSRVEEDCDTAQVEQLPENLEDDPEDTCEDSNEESEYETDNEVLDVAKVKSVEEVSRWKPMSKEENLDKLTKFSSLLCLPSGGKETEVKKILGGIVDSFHSSKQIKDLGPSSEDLGKGKRTPIPKKKL